MSFIHPIFGTSLGLYIQTPPLHGKVRERLRANHPNHRRMLCVQTSNRGKPCDFCTKKGTPFRCPRCKSAFYCSREHLKSDWKLHKRKCSGLTESGNKPAITDRICLRDNAGFFGLGPNPYRSNVPYLLGRTMRGSQSIELADFIVNSLYLTGYCIIDNFNGNSLALKVFEEVEALHQQGSLKDGQLASKSGKSGQKIRGDKTAWIDSNDPRCPATARHVSAVDGLVYLCNELIPDYDIRNRTKANIVCYPGNGAAYKRHVDNYNKDGRRITTQYYLNKDWISEMNGGLFRMYPEGSKPVDIEPQLDRLLIFWSDQRVPHEVLPVRNTRYSISLWYFDKTERERFLVKERMARLSKSLQQEIESKKTKDANIFKVPARVISQ